MGGRPSRSSRSRETRQTTTIIHVYGHPSHQNPTTNPQKNLNEPSIQNASAPKIYPKQMTAPPQYSEIIQGYGHPSNQNPTIKPQNKLNKPSSQNPSAPKIYPKQIHPNNLNQLHTPKLMNAKNNVNTQKSNVKIPDKDNRKGLEVGMKIGRFKCNRCNKSWRSATCYPGTAQKCSKCMNNCLPVIEGAHRQDLCGKCIQLGYNFRKK